MPVNCCEMEMRFKLADVAFEGKALRPFTHVFSIWISPGLEGLKPLCLQPNSQTPFFLAKERRESRMGIKETSSCRIRIGTLNQIESFGRDGKREDKGERETTFSSNNSQTHSRGEGENMGKIRWKKGPGWINNLITPPFFTNQIPLSLH